MKRRFDSICGSGFQPRLILALLLCLALTAACAGPAVKPITEWSPKQRAAYFMGVYNSQHDAYKAQVAYPDLTAAEKDVLRAKKRALVAVYPMIQAYDLVVAAGGVPSASDEAAILELLDELQRATVKRL
jgi:hypothetical protein